MSKSIAIIGGGILGLATAYRLLNKGYEINLFEKEKEVALHQTGNNSGVIHSGLYYKPGSLKAKFAVRGLKQMIAFCKENAVPFDQCGKVVVATNLAEKERLHTLYQRGMSNGLSNLRLLNATELKIREPYVEGIEALLVPEVGIVDYGQVCKTLQRLLEKNGVKIHLNSKIEKLKFQKKWFVTTRQSTAEYDYLVNCAGLYCDEVYQKAGGSKEVRIIPFRGEYYMLKPESRKLVKHLIYPVADPQFPFLGVHFTRMMGGGVECGPNAVLAFKREGYKKTDFSFLESWRILSFLGFWKFVSKHWKYGFGEYSRSLSKKRFCKSLQKLIPAITEDDLIPGGAGVRAQAMNAEGNLLEDFHLKFENNAVHVLNAPSPAATASLAIGEEIVSFFLSNV